MVNLIEHHNVSFCLENKMGKGRQNQKVFRQIVS